MPITRINIKEYQQFKNFDLHLSYPENHPKAGQALEKVCFIGQNGTGKTTLLNILKHRLQHLNEPINEGYSIEINQAENKNTRGVAEPTPIYSKHQNTAKLIYFPAEIADFVNQAVHNSTVKSIDDYFATSDDIKKSIQAKRDALNAQDFFDFSQHNPLELWDAILMDIRDYRTQKRQYSEQIADHLLENNTQVVQELTEQFRQWKLAHPNPLNRLAVFMNDLLAKFNVKIDEEPDLSKSEQLKFIHLATLNTQQSISRQHWSTGTKQIIDTILPLFHLNTNGAVVLFDEPERSLFPDIQLKIIDYYTKLAPNAQFFFATHSPIIAAAFEPYERIILNFDEAGFITSDSCMSGHAPIGDDPNDVLLKDFHIGSLMNEQGRKQWERYVALESLVKEADNPEQKKKWIVERVKLGNQYNFEEIN